MNKISLIIAREYITRVRNKTFLLSTFLLPVVMLLFIFGAAFLSINAQKDTQKIAVVNAPAIFSQNLRSDSARLQFDMVTAIDSNNYAAKGYNALLDLKGDSTTRKFVIHSAKQVNIDTKEAIEKRLNEAYEAHLLQQKGIEKNVLEKISKDAANAYAVENRIKNEKGGSTNVNAALNTGIGMASGVLIYITMFVFGAMVMRGVMEEKTNRIAEVMVSSVKPFQLMMGKILGIAAVGLTQLLLWIILITLLSSAATMIFSHQMLQQVGETSQHMPMGGNTAAATGAFDSISTVLGSVNWLMIVSCFLFYFLAGYLFYAALFASVGSVINEDPQEAQSLMLPITMPIIFGFIILTSNVNTPDSPAMVWGSMIPFTSPIVMMGRIPSGVPWYELVASMALLVGGFLFTTWLAGKIYRTGILMYGKKGSWKEMLRWAFRKS